MKENSTRKDIMNDLIRETTTTIASFTYLVMGLSVVISAILFAVATWILPEWKGMAIKIIIGILFAGALLAFGAPLIEYLSSFNSF